MRESEGERETKKERERAREKEGDSVMAQQKTDIHTVLWWLFIDRRSGRQSSPTGVLH